MLNTSAEFKVNVYEPVREFKARAFIEVEESLSPYFNGFRYVREWLSGNSVNEFNHWNAIKVFSGATDRALGILPTSNEAISNATRVTDGDDSSYASAGVASKQPTYMQIDLGSVREDITSIQIIHYYADRRTYYGSKIEISEDGVTWRTLRDANIEGVYPETQSGVILFPNNNKINVDFSDKVTGSLTPNPNNAKYRVTTVTIDHWNDFTAEATDDQYRRIKGNDNLSWISYSTSLNIRSYHYYGFDIIRILENYYGPTLWQGKTTLADKIIIAKEIITSLALTWYGWGESPTGKKATLQTFSVSLNKWDDANGKSHTSGITNDITITSLSRYTTNTPANKIDDNGFFHAMAFSEKADGVTRTYLQTEFIKLEVETNIKRYDDNDIVRMNILEEISVLNESLPSNELQLTLDNSQGDFNFLSFDNMHLILANKPKIQVELGLLTKRVTYGKFTGEMIMNKSYNGTDNVGEIQITTVNGNEVYHPNGTRYIATGGKEVGTHLEGSVNVGTYFLMYIGQNYGRFRDKKPYTSYSEDFVLCQQQGNMWLWFPNSATGIEFTPNWNYDCLVAEVIKTTAVTGAGIDSLTKYRSYYDDTFEWLPTGTFFLSDWKNEITNKIITLIGTDFFNLLSEISYEPVGITNLKDLATDVLIKSGVPSHKIIIDNSLANITVNNFPTRIDSRTALQHIGIAGISAVFQDRYGNVVIKPFKSIDESNNYLNYPTTQNAFYSYPGSNTYIINNTGGGMKYLDFDQMFSHPEVSLERSIYQLIVNVYTGQEYVERLYTNDFIQGTNGQSFTIDNPLINNTALADQIAAWYIKEINYNAFYSVTWRQNPALECTDIILVEDSFSAEKQTRIYRQELNYQGYLEGITESRGGV